MIKHLKIILIVLFTVCCNTITFTQITYLQEIYHGGITGDGYDQWLSNQPGQFDIYIEPGSTIKKAILLTSVIGEPEDRIVNFNGFLTILSASNPINDYYVSNYNSYSLKYRTIATDVTSLISPSLNSYSISPPIQNSNFNEYGAYCEFYLLVLYENPLMQLINTNLYINNIQPQSIQSYTISNINPIDLSKSVGLGIHVSHFCDTIQDGSFIKVDGSLVGLLGGIDDNSLEPCSGISSSFYYQNEQLFGLGNDVANNTMNGVDGIANIESYILNNLFFNIEFDYQSNLGPYSNPVHQLFLAYSTNCTPFPVSVPSDTTACYKSPLQLNSSGGQRYEWQSPNGTTNNPAPGLSCSDCPNPIFSADSSMFYTVRIWNNDSCSIVRPLKITVLPQPKSATFTNTNTDCGTSAGSITATGVGGALSALNAISENGDTLAVSGNKLSNLSAGKYTVFYTDTNGCHSKDSLLTIQSENNTKADFTVTPSAGGAPLSVTVTNTSQNATNYSWSLNGEPQNDPFNGFLADTSGVYTVQLIAWKNDILCADTAYVNVLVYDSLITTIPNIFTPNDDHINDIFSVTVNIPVHCELLIFNRWGNEVQHFNGTLNAGINALWDGNSNGKNVIDGTYFYKLIFKLDETTTNCEIIDCSVEEQGFVMLVR